MCPAHPNPGPAADVLLAALADARQRKEQAAQDMRLLLAYAREFAFPAPVPARRPGRSRGHVDLRYPHRLHPRRHRSRQHPARGAPAGIPGVSSSAGAAIKGRARRPLFPLARHTGTDQAMQTPWSRLPSTNPLFRRRLHHVQV